MGILDALLQGIASRAAGSGGMAPGAGAGAGARPGMGAGGDNPLLQLVFQLIQQNGGLPGILSKFQQAGYGSQADSWVSTGKNLPISPDVLGQVLGQGQLGRLAEQFGMSREEAQGGLAAALPDVVDGLTPHGSLPGDHDDLVSRALEILTRKAG